MSRSWRHAAPSVRKKISVKHDSEKGAWNPYDTPCGEDIG
jgi:hypothetical protein